MTDLETTQLTQEIINKAQEGVIRPFSTIKFWSEFKYYQGLAKATKVVIKTLEVSAEKLFKEYCKDVIAGISDITKLLAYLQILDIADYYIADLEIIQQMVKDYDDYLGDCNFLNFVYAFLGAERET